MKKALLLLGFAFLYFCSFAQKLDSTALILIDIQDFYFPGGKMELVEPEQAAKQAKHLLSYFRKNGGLVVHVRHNFEPGGDIHKLVQPIPGEKVVSKNEINSFLETDLNKHLRSNNIQDVILAGMQTHMCLEAGTRAAHDLGYNCTVVGDACTTRDLEFGSNTIKAQDVHFSTLVTLKNYAKVVNLSEYLK